MLLKNHKTIGQMCFDGQEQFDTFLKIHENNPEIHAEDFIDVDEDEIKKYEAKVERDNTPKDFKETRKLRNAKKTAIRMTQHYDMMGQIKKAKAWRQYYQKVYVLIDDPKWPNVDWPAEPEDSEEK